MNTIEIRQKNEDGFDDVVELLNDLKDKTHTPFINSVIVANGLLDTANQIMHGLDQDYHTSKLTPYQRQIFVWCYLEILTGFIEFALENHGMPESISVPK